MTRSLAFILALYAIALALMLPPAGIAAPPATAPATQPARPAVVPAKLARGASLLWSNEGFVNAPDLGMPRAAIVSPSTLWWAAWDVAQLKRHVGDAELITVNFEGSSAEEFGDQLSEDANRTAVMLIGERLKWVRRTFPGRLIDWNTGPVVFPIDIARYQRTAAMHEQLRVIHAAVREFILDKRLIDSVSVQVYYHAKPANGDDPRQHWLKYAAWSIEGLQPWGLPIRLMVNPAYEWESPAALYGQWITGADLDWLLAQLSAINPHGVLWWGSPKDGTWAGMRKAPELGRVVEFSNKIRE